MHVHPERRRDLRILGIVISVALLLSLPYLTGISLLDEGAFVHIAERIADGEVLYRDVATGIMPGSYYLHAFLFRTFGASLLTGRILMMLLFCGAAAGVFLLLRAVTTRTVASLSTLCFVALTVHYWRYPNYSPQAILWILGMLGAGVAFLRTRRDGWLVVSALLLGMALLFKQNYGALASLGLAAGLLGAPVPWIRRLRDVAVAAGVAAIPLLVTAGLLAMAGAFPDFWNFTVVVPLGVPTTVFARPFPPLWGEPGNRLWRDLLQYLPFEELFSLFPGWVFGHTTWSMGLIRVAYYLPVLLLGVAAFRWIRRRGGDDGGVGGLLLFVSGFLFLGVFPRVDAHHLILALAPWFICMGWLSGAAPRKGVLLAWGVAAVVLVAGSTGAQVARIASPDPSRVLTAWLPLPRGGVWLSRGTENGVSRSLRSIEEHVPADEALFVAPAAPMYYFLSGRRNPTRYPLILPGAMDEAEVIGDLDSVRWGLLQDGAFEDFTFESVAPGIWEHVRGEYRLFDGTVGRTPLPPYLVERALPRPSATPERIGLVDGRPAILHAPAVERVGGTSLLQPSLSTPPPYRVLSRYPGPDPQRLRASWSITYLRPSLLVVAPWGWSKLMTVVETPVEPEMELRCAVALDPESWGTPGRRGQGGVAEIWIAAGGEPPRRAWRRWIDPRRRTEDRRWREVALDLNSFVPAGEIARIFLVSGPSPGLDGADAKIAWSTLEVWPEAGARFVAVDPEQAGPILEIGPEELVLLAEAVAAYPGSATTWSAWAEALLAMDRVDEALQVLQEATTHPSAGAEHHASLASLLERTGDPEGALAAAREGLRRDPGHATALAVLARLERRAGNREAAISLGRRATEADPGNPRPWIDLSDALRESGQARRARKVLDRAAAMELDGGGRGMVARRFLLLGDLERARDEARRAVELDDASVPAWGSLADSLAASGDAEGALTAWRRAEELAPEEFAVWLGLAPALHGVGRTEEAMGLLGRARRVAEADASALGRVARAYARIGGTSEAAATWRQVQALAPGGDLEAEARREATGVPE